MAYQETPLSELVSRFRTHLGNLEERRTAVSGEVGILPRDIVRQRYAEVTRGALRISSQTEQRLQKTAPLVEEEILLALAGAVYLAATTYQSQAKHGEISTQPKNRLLDKAFNQLEKLEHYLPTLDEINHTLHGPIIWRAEIARTKARAFERRPTKIKNNLEKAAACYQQAIAAAEQKVFQTILHPDQELLMGALGVGGTARVELAQVNDILLHDFEEDILMERLGRSKSQKEEAITIIAEEKGKMEEEIKKLFIDGRDMLWQTIAVPNYDRLETIEGRVLDYLKRHLPAEQLVKDPDFITTMEHFQQLASKSSLVF